MIEQLSRVSGIDVERAMVAMSGQTQLYLKLVKNFTIEQQQKTAELVHLHQTNQLKTLNRRAHSLKTFAAYIGAYEISAYSAQLESLTTKGHSDKILVTKVGQLLDDLLTQLTPLYDIESKTISDNHQAHFSITAFKQLLHTTVPLLLQSNTAVDDVLPSLYKMSRGSQFETSVETLIAYVDEIEFATAARLAQGLLAQLTQLTQLAQLEQ